MTEHREGGDFTESETMQARSWPCLRQFCVFLENRVGRLSELMRLVEDLDTQVVALSIVDSVDFAMVRLMFSNTDRGREKLTLSSFLFSESDVVGVELPESEKPLSDVCTALVKAELNIHHAYPLLYRRRGRSVVAMYVDDVDTAAQILRDAGFRIITESDLLDDEF
ncbi:acetolactate synthase [Planctellipticum variicoloris]|uniref:acetolactate synthase n=1 Tax=Planctellipticum variicoloris TaxID=3064265 RepID=UPI002BE33877|nr:acetolactate synthase [Planctomycetaceae bacterium SH412]HTN01058.1 acetolactate synthase [Planctomycetaceae bacterium]